MSAASASRAASSFAWRRVSSPKSSASLARASGAKVWSRLASARAPTTSGASVSSAASTSVSAVSTAVATGLLVGLLAPGLQRVHDVLHGGAGGQAVGGGEGGDELIQRLIGRRQRRRALQLLPGGRGRRGARQRRIQVGKRRLHHGIGELRERRDGAALIGRLVGEGLCGPGNGHRRGGSHGHVSLSERGGGRA